MDETAVKEWQNMVIDESRQGYIVVSTIDGPARMKLSDFIEQPADGMLYDLNRLEEVVLTFIDSPKWMNDFAVAKTIRALKDRIDALEAKSGTGDRRESGATTTPQGG